MSAMRRFCLICFGSSIYNMAEACCDAVVVLPHHLAPSISTAPIPERRRLSILSAILGLYSFLAIFIIT